MEDKASWPIRVGGIYRSRSVKEITSHVTAIDGETVHFEEWYSGEKRPYEYDSLDADLFRELRRPEDASPLPALVNALQQLRHEMVQLMEDDKITLPEPTRATIEERISLAETALRAANAPLY